MKLKFEFSPLVLASSFIITASMASANDSVSVEPPIAVVLAVGDITGCAADEMKRASATAKMAIDEIKAARTKRLPVRVLLLGDLAYPDGTRDEFLCFDRSWGNPVKTNLGDAKSDLLAVPGNHEYRTADASAYKDYFATAGMTADLWMDGLLKTNITSHSGVGWTIIGLDSEIKSAGKQKQVGALRDSLSSKALGCVLAFWHRPVFSSGKHGNDASMIPEYKLLYDYGSTVVLNGHDHNFEELAPHNPQGASDADGISAFVVGTGGKGLRDEFDNVLDEISVHRDAENYGILKLVLFEGRYDWEFITGESILYQGAGTCKQSSKS